MSDAVITWMSTGSLNPLPKKRKFEPLAIHSVDELAGILNAEILSFEGRNKVSELGSTDAAVR